MKKQNRLWFTLVEMLIGIVIIGILSAAILPKISNHMAKVRDLKRKQDLQNIAAALMQYKAAHGEFPKKNKSVTEEMRKKHPQRWWKKPERRDYAGSVNQFSEALIPYLTEIPKDPDKNSHMNLSRSCWESYYPKYNTDSRCLELDLWKGILWGEVNEIGEYFLLQITTSPGVRGHAMLFSKIETIDEANWVNWWFWMGFSEGILYRENTKLSNHKQRLQAREWLYARCTEVKKASRKWYMFDKQNRCKYAEKKDHKNLYYVLLVE